MGSKLFAAAILAVMLTSHMYVRSARGDEPSEKTIVACVGDSITFGSGTTNPKTSSYPVQLSQLLDAGGGRFVVHNFGVGGTTLLNQGDHPYQKTGAFKKALASKANVVVIMLGTNDTKPQNWKFKDQFVADYKDLIGKFAALESKPKIYICLPPPVPQTGNYGINEAGVREQIPLIKQLADSDHVELVDNYAALKDHPELLPDNVHPNEAGAALLARSVYHAITGKDAPAGK
jgi:acyl-CoA thioesterase-1